jgi:hypothetical protein
MTQNPQPDEARYGWASDFHVFEGTPANIVRRALERFIGDASPEQVRAWDGSIEPLQQEVREVIAAEPTAERYASILEYELPRESRRPDVVLLISGAVVVLECKGQEQPTQADLDQASAYARDLRCYHRDCESVSVHAVLVATRAKGYLGFVGGVHVIGPDALDALIAKLDRPRVVPPITPQRFLDPDAYRPLPSLIRAARELFRTGDLGRIKRARSYTDPCVDRVAQIVHEAARTETRRLVLVTGVPGAGKTLVGLRIVHAGFLDDLAVPRSNGKPTAPAVFLSGNGPLVEVLQYELRSAGGGGKAFVRGVKDYVKQYTKRRASVPPEHVLVFDEAQRAWDAEHAQRKHQNPQLVSEPEAFIEFAERIPKWCVVVGLIGGGQEIHLGEEAGLGQWHDAIIKARKRSDWHVHGPLEARDAFKGEGTPFLVSPDLNLDKSLRFHAAEVLHEWVAGVLEMQDATALRTLAQTMEEQGLHLRVTRDLETAKRYLRTRYKEDQAARFGILRSARDKALEEWGITQPTRFFQSGPWYADEEDSPNSCRRLREAITEFQAQGLELDATLLAWGTDLLVESATWSNKFAKRYLRSGSVKDPMQLRKNAYRVLLTRGRDATVIFLPPIPELNETFNFLVAAGVVELEQRGANLLERLRS